MKVAILNQHYGPGGVENFLSLLVQEFLLLPNIEVGLFALCKPSALEEELWSTRFGVSIHWERELQSEYKPDILMATNPSCLTRAARLCTKYGWNRCALIAAVYQTKMFSLEVSLFNLHNRIAQNVFGSLPSENIIFCNAACKLNHATKLERYEESRIIPLIVNSVLTPDSCSRQVSKVTGPEKIIVSIGRFVPFKTYNLTMITVMLELLEKGHNVYWEIYGSGPLQAAMSSAISDAKLDGRVRLMGNLDYDEMGGALARAFVYVGSGLSAMEAACAGIPTIPAIEYSEAADAYGFIHEISGDSFFEPNLPFIRVSISSLLERLLTASASEYSAMQQESSRRMISFGARDIGQRYAEAFVRAKHYPPQVSKLFWALSEVSASAYKVGKYLVEKLVWKMK
jgi:glycosyltransferase involved in cell wall biosynthesis